MSDLVGKAKDALNSDKGEKGSDSALGKVADKADSATGGKHTEQIDKAEQSADKHVGNG
jgi:MT0933-like antitoxin protein